MGSLDDMIRSGMETQPIQKKKKMRKKKNIKKNEKGTLSAVSRRAVLVTLAPTTSEEREYIYTESHKHVKDMDSEFIERLTSHDKWGPFWIETVDAKSRF